jgi:glycogen synthase
MSEKRILLASLLKPVNDTRLYEKLGLSLSKIPGVSIHLVGYAGPIPTNAPGNITFYPAFRFNRLSLGRAAAQTAFYKLLVKVKPELLIVTTHEFLLVSLLYKKRYGCKVIYDIQENYSLNLRAQHNYPGPLKHVMAMVIRSVERLAASGIDHFLLAERSYADELPFLDERYTFIENKYKPSTNQSQSPATPVAIPGAGPLRLLYSGTIAEEYGIWEAIRLAETMHAHNKGTKLTIIGYCANAQTLAKLKAYCSGKQFIELIGGNQLVPHSQILDQIRQSHIGLLPYRPNPSTFRCIPTKVYEYMAHALPILIQQNPMWKSLVDGNDAGLSIDFRTDNVETLYDNLLQRSFYNAGIPAAINWDSEEQKLLTVVEDILAI